MNQLAMFSLAREKGETSERGGTPEKWLTSVRPEGIIGYVGGRDLVRDVGLPRFGVSFSRISLGRCCEILSSKTQNIDKMTVSFGGNDLLSRALIEGNQELCLAIINHPLFSRKGVRSVFEGIPFPAHPIKCDALIVAFIGKFGAHEAMETFPTSYWWADRGAEFQKLFVPPAGGPQKGAK